MTALTVLIDGMLRMATALAWPALGELLMERAGIFNVGLEACVLWGALGGLLGSLWFGNPWGGVLVGAGLGCVVGLAFGWLVVGQQLNSVLVGTAMNLMALGGTAFIYREAYGKTGTGVQVTLLEPLFRTDWPVVGPILGQSLLFVMAVFVAVGLHYFFQKTRAGIQWRAVGEDAESAAIQGVAVHRIRMLACASGCALAGIGGAFLVVGTTGAFVERMSAGRGFMALAIVVLGRWQPGGVWFGALLFGAAGAMQFFFQALGTGIAYQFMLMLPYLLTLAALALRRNRDSVGPAGLTGSQS